MRRNIIRMGLSFLVLLLTDVTTHAQGLSRGFVGRGAFGARTFGQSVGGPTRSLFGPRTLGRSLGGPANASYFGPRYLGAGVGGVALYPRLQYQAVPNVYGPGVYGPTSNGYFPGFPPAAPVAGGAGPGMAPFGPTAISTTAQQSPLSNGRIAEGIVPAAPVGSTTPVAAGGVSVPAAPLSTRPSRTFRFQSDNSSPRQVSSRFAGMLRRIPQLRSTGPVSVTMQGRTAVLTGVVDSAETRSLIDRITRLEPGVAEVRNELVISGN